MMLQATGIEVLAAFGSAKLEPMRYPGKRAVYMASVSTRQAPPSNNWPKRQAAVPKLLCSMETQSSGAVSTVVDCGGVQDTCMLSQHVYQLLGCIVGTADWVMVQQGTNASPVALWGPCCSAGLQACSQLRSLQTSYLH